MSYTYLRKSLWLITIACSFQASAQQIITFDQSSGPKRFKEDKEYKKNSVTVGLISPVNGYFPAYYERAVTKFLSVQIGAGLTFRSFGNDFGQMIWNDGKNSEFVDNAPIGVMDIDDQYNHYRYRKASIGSYFAVSPKIYFSDNCMDGFFLAPAFEWKNYRNKAQLANTNKTTNDVTDFSSWTFESDDRDVPHATETMDESMNCMDITLNIGGHYQMKNSLALGWSVGLGLRSMKSSRLDIYAKDNGFGEQYFRNTVRNYDSMKPLFTVNLLLGGCF